MQPGTVSEQAFHAPDHEAWISFRANHCVSLATTCCAVGKHCAVVATDDMADHWGNRCTVNFAIGAVIAKCQVKSVLLLLQRSRAAIR